LKVLITQSNYIPWKGYFHSIKKVDKFVVFDDMQYTKRDWRNRNLIKTPQGLKWLTIPVIVKGKFNQPINETKISDDKWNVKHLNILKENYKKAEHYKEVIDWIESLYIDCIYEYLTDINQYFIYRINEFLNINTEILNSKKFNLDEDRNYRLVNICKELNASEYYTGPAAKNYLDEALFSKNDIILNYFDYSVFKEYKQINGTFEHSVSIIDLIFNIGEDAYKYI
jgi:hypothetical protein